MDKLTKEDWQWIFQACQERWARADPKPGEPKPSKQYKEEKARIFQFLYSKAYSSNN